MTKNRKIGVHTSIAGGLSRSLEITRDLGCNTMQIFSHNPRGWAVKTRDEDEIGEFRKVRDTYGIGPIFIHTSYLINLASADPSLADKSVNMILQEMDIADSLGAEYIVLHTGSASEEDPEIARKRAIQRLTDIARTKRWRAGILLENTAGERGDITSRIEELAEIFKEVPGSLIAGICIDTCHAFSAGYDIRNDEGIQLFLDEIVKHAGIHNIKLLHLNDAKGMLGAGIDRHEHIGFGNIGLEGFRILLNNPLFSVLPLILETPKKSPDDDLNNIKTVRNLL